MDDKKIIKTGIMMYENVEYKVYICESSFMSGSGDYEDESEIRDDKYIKCYEILYTSTLNDKNVSSGGYYKSFEEALKKIESNSQFKKWI